MRHLVSDVENSEYLQRVGNGWFAGGLTVEDANEKLLPWIYFIAQLKVELWANGVLAIDVREMN